MVSLKAVWVKRGGKWVRSEKPVFCRECKHCRGIKGGMYGAVIRHDCLAEIVAVKVDYFSQKVKYALCRRKNRHNDCPDFASDSP